MTQENNKDLSLNRRDFLKLTAATGVIAAAGGAKLAAETQGDNTRLGRTSSLTRREYDSIDEMYDIADDYERMDQKNTIFNRAGWDPLIAPIMVSFALKNRSVVPDPFADLPGHTAIEKALEQAGWAGCHTGVGGPPSFPNSGDLNDWDRHANPTRTDRHQFESPEEANRIVKRAARFLGADIVGVAPYDERWVYSSWYNAGRGEFLGGGETREAVFPFEPRSVIALAFEMDYDALRADGPLSSASVGLGYSEMAEAAHKVAIFLNELGYKALPTGNDTGMSIPIAAQAGLGELSRMGMLITEEYGPRVRLAKVFTDLEITPDKPKSFGVWEFCKRCKKCAELCPASAISHDNEPSEIPGTGSVSNHPGVKKWHQDNERCIEQWETLGYGCSICITVCPYNKLDAWHHDVAEMVVSVPGGRDIARVMDDAFGYGKINGQNVEYFWNEADLPGKER